MKDQTNSNMNEVSLSGENVHLNCPPLCPSIYEMTPKRWPEKVTLHLAWDQLDSLDEYMKAIFSMAPEPGDLDSLLVQLLLVRWYKDKLHKLAAFPQPEQKVNLKAPEALALLKCLLEYRPSTLDLGARIHLDSFTAILHQKFS